MLKPNRWGLFDMLGNVAEWCDDSPAKFRDRESLDVSDSGSIFPQTRRPIRGGSYDHGFFTQLRSASTDFTEAQQRARPIGFRVAKTLFTHTPEKD